MSVDDAIKRLKTESRSIIEAREQQEKAKEITAGRKNISTDGLSGSRLKRIADAFKRMDENYWQDFFKRQNDGLKGLTGEEEEKYIEACVYEYKRMEAIYKGYERILKEPHHLEEHLKKLKQDLKNMAKEYDKKCSEQISLFSKEEAGQIDN